VAQGVGLSSNPSTTKKEFFNVCMAVKIKILIFSGDIFNVLDMDIIMCIDIRYNTYNNYNKNA
jgi:hypothetical protein